MQLLKDKDANEFLLDDETWEHISEFHPEITDISMVKSKVHALRISYDKRADVLYLAFGTPQAGVDREVNPGVFVRVDEQTNRAAGMTILDFESRFSEPLTDSLPIDLAEYLTA